MPLKGAAKGAYEMLAGATLIEGVYAAMATDSRNEYVKDALLHGIPAAIVLNPLCPPDVMGWLCNNHNFYNVVGGSATSWLELIGKVADIEASWKESGAKP